VFGEIGDDFAHLRFVPIWEMIKRIDSQGTPRMPGYPLILLRKSAGAHERKWVSFRSLAEERRESSEVVGNAGVKFVAWVKECASF
jgi:hypothetical protein